MPSKTKKAIVLLSGGLDSSTCLYWAKSRGYRCHALAVSYGQRHIKEIRAARKIAQAAGTEFLHITLQLPWLKSSSLVDKKAVLPSVPLSKIGKKGIPSTYVPGRNLLFVSLAASLADSIGAEAIVVGANALDYS
ncbi:MAG TPA: 7-cyano-7-deazaguanine synthase, partial [Elusimicrobiales bacterium]|nr:7-cyano-7-deazaguanine synthase [Elusimicrobiales bacterium]